MFLLVGLGNPGKRYAQTRHNAGFLVLDELARPARARINHREDQALTLRLRLEGEEVILAKPQTYMNLSGAAVAPLLQRYRIPLDRLVVAADDLDLPLGTLRLRPGGGSGGHHGLDSIIASLGTNAFARLRLGIGRPVEETVDHVLSGFTADEEPLFREAVARGAEALRVCVREGLEAAMNRFNRAPAKT